MTLSPYSGIHSHGEASDFLTDSSQWENLIAFEVALSTALYEIDLISKDSLTAIRNIAKLSNLNIASLVLTSKSSGTAISALVSELSKLAEAESPKAGDYIHFGATSQDVVDSALCMTIKNVIQILISDVTVIGDELARKIKAHGSELALSRTLLQPALPSTFGANVSSWLTLLATTRIKLKEAGSLCAIQYGGAVGTNAVNAKSAERIRGVIAKELKLANVAPWHSDRTRVLEITEALAHCGVTSAKIATDLILLSQAEVDEVSFNGASGSSSTMAHKANSIAAISALSSAARVPGLVMTVHQSAVVELQRGYGSWQAEAVTIIEILREISASIAWLKEAVLCMQVNIESMARNLENAGSKILSERIVTELVPAMGRIEAQKLITEITKQDGDFTTNLSANTLVASHLSAEKINELLKVGNYLGNAHDLTSSALTQWKA
jgi:3-carboxy-cis,cis-muconate cycloisomerase